MLFNLNTLAALLINIAVVFFVIYRFRFIIKSIRLNSYRGSWNSLNKYSFYGTVPRTFLTSVRIGAVTYKNTMHIYLNEKGVVLQKPALSQKPDLVLLPYAAFRLIEVIDSGLLSDGHAIFTVDGVDVWISQPFANEIIEKINHEKTIKISKE